MDENTKEKKNDREYNKAVLGCMTKLIEEKLEACKTVLPLVLTIVTTVLAFLFTQKYPSFSKLWWAIYAIVILLLTLISLLLVSFPKLKYEKPIKVSIFRKKVAPTFNPTDISTYQKLTSEEFDEQLQQYLDTDFTEIEKIQVAFLKEKINEYQVKKALLKLAYTILIFGVVVLMIIFCIWLFKV